MKVIIYCLIILHLLISINTLKLKQQIREIDIDKFRLNLMNELQSKKTFTSSVKETFDTKFEPQLALHSYGHSTNDEFVSFLGFLGDQSKKVAKEIESSNKYQ